jgi:hypothetical protein
VGERLLQLDEQGGPIFPGPAMGDYRCTRASTLALLPEVLDERLLPVALL